MTQPDDDSFLAALRDAVRLRDCLALALVPAVAVAVFTLPAARRRSLAFTYRDPSLVTAYTAQFVHFDAAHLAANVLGYALVAGFGYVLAALSGYRRLFGVTAATYLLAFPPALSWLNLALPRNAVGYGLSGLNMAFVGLLALVLVAYWSRLDDRISVRYAPGLFFAVVALIALIVPRAGTVTGIGAASVFVAAGYVVSARRSWPERPRSGRRPRLDRAGWLDAGILGVVTLFGYQFVGFDSLAADSGIVNVYVHLLGFCLGFIVPYTALALGVLGADRGFLSD
ncbi:hypothetical protein [Halolamina sp. C58]|uniref:hypothetical protein n=1 Tax=Halolamina sp. C58 TaxID=3421640 RepID=UPI003EC0EB1D